MSAACILLAASYLNHPNAWLWGGIHILLTAALPTLYIVYLYHRGRVSDPHLNVRSERFRPLVAALLTSSLSLGLLYSISAPRLLVLLAALNLIQLVLFLGITLRWKISAHCTAVASLAVLGFYLLGLTCSWLLAVVPVMAWARIYLGCHTPAQTMAGAILGASLWLACLLNFGF